MDRNVPPAAERVNQRSARGALIIAVGVLMLLGWTIAMLAMAAAPGWLHFFLTIGVFLLILGIVMSDTGGDG